MLVKIITPMEGPGLSRRRGEEVEIEDREAKRLIEAGYAQPVRSGPEPERAVKRGRKAQG